jgi:RNase H-like domain found in reverse transcriptase
MTPLGLLRMTTLPQGATNSVAQFVRIVTRILEDLIPDVCRPFLDDIGVKGPRTRYNDEEVAPGIRRFVLEHFQNLDRVLVAVELAGGVIGPKSQWCMDGIVVVGFVCGSEGRSPESSKVIKILDWPPCADLASTRAFLGVCVYYRIWICDFCILAEPIYRLSRKGVEFIWGKDQQLAMDSLKLALTSAPALVQIDYSEGAGLIVLAVDSSLKGWGGVMMQEDAEGKRHPSRYESGLWNSAEQNYDATKRECRGVLKGLKKVRF